MGKDLLISSAINQDLVPALFLGGAAMFLAFSGTWLLSRKLDNYSFVDVTWSFGLIVLLPLHALMTGGGAVRSAVVLAMGMLWSLRLGTYLLLRVRQHHPAEDIRYQVLRGQWKAALPARMFVFFQAQALLILLLSVPMLLAMRNGAPRLAWVEWLGCGVWCLGFLGESLADRQMQRFKSDPANKGRVCNTGLWRFSRHPNYFFESVIWWGFWLYACGSPWGWVTIYAPLLILWFLLRVTGIPLTEKCAVEGKGDAYREYQRTTSAFVPWFPRKSS